MKLELKNLRSRAALGAFAATTIAAAAWAADILADSVKLAPGVVRAMEGYELRNNHICRCESHRHLQRSLFLQHQSHRRAEARRQSRCAGESERLGLGAGRQEWNRCRLRRHLDAVARRQIYPVI